MENLAVRHLDATPGVRLFSSRGSTHLCEAFAAQNICTSRNFLTGVISRPSRLRPKLKASPWWWQQQRRTNPKSTMAGNRRATERRITVYFFWVICAAPPGSTRVCCVTAASGSGFPWKGVWWYWVVSACRCERKDVLRKTRGSHGNKREWRGRARFPAASHRARLFIWGFLVINFKHQHGAFWASAIGMFSDTDNRGLFCSWRSFWSFNF